MALPLLASRRLFSSFVFRGQPSTLSSNLSLVRIRGLHGGSLSPPSATLPRAVQLFSSRIAFSTAAAEDSGASQTLEGRYASALFRVAKKKNQLEKVYGDLESVRNALKDSSEFRLFVDSPAVSVQQKLDVLRQLVNRYKFDPLTGNLLTTLVENKRLPMLARVADAFDAMYRKEKGEVKCLVTSAKPLSAQQQKEIVAALQNRAGTQARLIIDYAVSPQIMGGLVVRLGEQVLDFSVATRLDRLQSQLLAPL
ncbi:ATP synthase F1, delta subunit protein [Toxoplasma gondii TgCatPRC2]|uniref:ATP synthase F1, delta subunit protein n=11 Tax=Toxoplasma gondii TaxID=5811 RepID=B9PSZ9_TOXGV|nr:ATP synthase F1, delta subunit protein [Toxoplasma gondii ME49]6TMH_G Chain G, Oligomycin sensitivity conferring protein (OSCP) [Toxoplasma gondii GT1]6TMI_G Chain G, Oligomycin sensitivity conferring protein (OSCP) [Toxoplasma gondii GT1]6TMK_G1 Chain G1, Oligomycin sensitivity conferring protein (OSCP) [Toxoplasma gondii GT1]6TMK_G2 Chain G2, Oligomycin sensitivity conferring protein (OSCP) [Toxoplasma gondii GT1]6TML_G1 Chain G1, Oligomycin sensitivity conferring protein (OSCP) [Toxoplas|eukprot:XP_002369152.1 ATP synthase F1, delta subunit protein [Toxoplasma gondii ME49]